MKKKMMNKFTGIIVLIILFLGIVVPNFNTVNVYASDIKYSYKESYDMIPFGTSLEWYRKNSIAVTPEKNPKLFIYNKNTNSYKLNPKELPLDGRIYSYKDEKTGKEIFYKVLSFKASANRVNFYEVEVQKAIYDGKQFIMYSKPNMYSKKNPLLYRYLKLLGKIGNSDKSTPTPGEGVPEAPAPEITEPQVPESELPSPEITEPQVPELEAPAPETTEPQVPEPEVPAPKITEPQAPESEVPAPQITEPEQISIFITRLGGATRIETALDIADEFRGASKLNAVILSSASNFPDALSGAVLTSKYSAPILLVNKSAKHSKATLDYIAKNANHSAQIVILGSSGVIDNSIIDSLKNFGFSKIKRLGGSNRFETNTAIINDLAPGIGTDVIISNGHGFPDALSISSVSTIKGIPIILTKNKELPTEAKSLLSSIKPNKIYITGGTGSITTKVEDELKKYSSDIIRLGGSDRYETSMVISNYFKSDLEGEYVILASGLNFPDALAGTALALKYNAPMLLVNPNNPSLQKSFILNNNKRKIFVLGSTGTVSNSILNTIVDR